MAGFKQMVWAIVRKYSEESDEDIVRVPKEVLVGLFRKFMESNDIKSEILEAGFSKVVYTEVEYTKEIDDWTVQFDVVWTDKGISAISCTITADGKEIFLSSI